MLPYRRFSLLKRGFFAVLDQGLFSGANFVANIFLARWVEPVQYGAFAVAFSIFLGLALVHTAILIDPMLVFGSGKYSGKRREYIGVLLYGHFLVTGGIATSVALIALIFWQFKAAILAQAFAGLAISCPFVLLIWLTRAGAYLYSRPDLAMGGSTLYFAVMVISISALIRVNYLSPVSALLAMGLAGLMASLFHLFFLRPRLRHLRGKSELAIIWADHCKYGSWSVLAQGTYWLSGQILVVLVPALLGLEKGAALAAILNLFRPLTLMMQSLTALALPEVSAVIHSKDAKNLLTTKIRILLFFSVGAAILYSTGLIVFADDILHYLYGGKYDQYVSLVILFALTFTASAVIQVHSLVIKASGNVRSLVSVWIFSSLIVIIIGVPLMLIGGGIIAAVGVFAFSYLIAMGKIWQQVKNVEIFAATAD